jgi:hypothetical protein
MSTKYIHLVGDRFAEFAKNDDVLTITQAIDLVTTRAPGESYVLVPTQGVPDHALAELEARVARAGLGHAVEIDWEARQSRADRGLTHKHRPENIMISEPWRIREDSYGAQLCVDDRCAEMSDHTTGQHIQGMVLIEAARQMFLAVSERFFLQSAKDRSFYFVINKLDVSYHAFAFPVATDITYQIVDKQLDPRGTFRCEAKIGFHQAGVLVTQVVVRFTAYDAQFIRVREDAMAKDVARAAIATHARETLRKTG